MGMKCDVPNCENEATVHLTEIRDGKKHEMHLCERCAQEKGLTGKPHFSLSDLLAGIASQAQASRTKRGKEPACAACGTTLSQFQASGRFGCAECYTTFKEDVQSLVEKIHDSSQHVGKVPKRVSSEVVLQKDIRQLQVDLKRAIRREDYETAAAIRDQVRQIEEKLKSGATGGAADSAGAEQVAPPPAKPQPPQQGQPGRKKGSSDSEKKSG
jgi:protein arginine kinase activator